ncbi:MAG: hypothetical protein QM662_17155 [Gordonia sp. (in: high G+C Gram-positive bacteria)]
MRVRGNRAGWVCVLILAVVVGCGQRSPQLPTGSAVAVAPADLLLDPARLPTGFTPTPLTVAGLVAADGVALTAAARNPITPARCRPTADAALNRVLTDANTAVLAAQSGRGTVIVLTTTATRDIAADLATTTGGCARTETTITAGTLAGAHVVTGYVTLPTPASPAAVVAGHLVRSTTTTVLADGGVAHRIGYAGYAAVVRPGGRTVGVQVTAAGEITPALPAPGIAATAPLSDAEFSALFGDALAAAAGDRQR